MNYDDRLTEFNEENIKQNVYNLIEEVTDSSEDFEIDADQRENAVVLSMLYLAASLIQISEYIAKIVDSIDGK